MLTIWHSVKSGHWPSLMGAWLHLTVSFMVWLLIGAMSLPLADSLQLSDSDMSWLVSLPLLGGAILRVIAGWSADWFGARPTALAILIAEFLVLCWGWLGVTNYGTVQVFAIGLGVAGASFAVTLPIAGRAYPSSTQGLALGLVASGNFGTVLILFFAPRWAATMDWHQICGLMACIVAVTTVGFVVAVPRTPLMPQPHSLAWWHHAAQVVRRRSAYWLCGLYAITFGGFVGLCSLLPLLLHDVYHVDAIQAGTVAAMCGLLGSLIRPVGGYVADRHGGMRALYYVLPAIAGSIVAIVSPSQATAMLMMLLATAAMGIGNGVVFQLVAEWFPNEIGVASGVVGACGAVGGFLLPLLAGMTKDMTGSYELGFWLFAGLTICAWGTVMVGLQTDRSSPSTPHS